MFASLIAALLVQATGVTPAAAGQVAAVPAAASQIAAVQAAAGSVGWPAGTTNAIRFTNVSPEARGAMIFEARRTPAGAERTIIALAQTDAGWDVQSRETRRLAVETFAYMATRIDAAISKGAPAVTTDCPALPDYLSEHDVGGRIASLRGACGTDHPNLAIAKLFGVAEE